MISKLELGRRIREARLQKGMTLKQLDQLSGFSATHISEIERGKTSPTIGALIRVAIALGREPSYFIEEELLPETALVPRDQREALPTALGEAYRLTPGIPGGRLNASLFHLRPGEAPLRLPRLEGEEGGFVLRGRVRAVVDGREHILSDGDSIHYSSDEIREFSAAGSEGAEFILIATWKIRSENEPERPIAGREPAQEAGSEA